MSERLAAAEAALKAGRRPEAIEHLAAAVSDEPARPAQVYRVLVMQLYQLGRFAEAEPYAAQATKRFPRELDLLNLHGVILRRLGRYPEALAALEQAGKLKCPGSAPRSA